MWQLHSTQLAVATIRENPSARVTFRTYRRRKARAEFQIEPIFICEFNSKSSEKKKKKCLWFVGRKRCARCILSSQWRWWVFVFFLFNCSLSSFFVSSFFKRINAVCVDRCVSSLFICVVWKWCYRSIFQVNCTRVDGLLQVAIATVVGYDAGDEQSAVISDQHDPSPLISPRQTGGCSSLTVSLSPCRCVDMGGPAVTVAITCKDTSLDNAGLKAVTEKLPPTLAIRKFILSNNALFHLL